MRGAWLVQAACDSVQFASPAQAPVGLGVSGGRTGGAVGAGVALGGFVGGGNDGSGVVGVTGTGGGVDGGVALGGFGGGNDGSGVVGGISCRVGEMTVAWTVVTSGVPTGGGGVVRSGVVGVTAGTVDGWATGTVGAVHRQYLSPN